MKAVITGGTGFLGRHLVWRFAEAGEVVFTGRSVAAANEVSQLAPGSVSWVQIDHDSDDAAEELTKAARGADVLVHCAALSAPWGAAEDFYSANVKSTMDVLTACDQANVKRLIHISTPSLYFDYQDRLNVGEQSALPPPVNEYARTKALAEQVINKAPVTETVILRPRALFGPWDATVVPRILRVMQRGSLPLMRGGDIQLDLTYIDNAIEAVWLAATKPLPHSLATYNVTNGEPRSLSDLLEALAREFKLPLRTRKIPWPVVRTLAHGMEIISSLTGGKEPLMTRYSAGVLAFSQTLDISALRHDLDYAPKVGIDEGIKRHAQWWLKQPSNSA